MRAHNAKPGDIVAPYAWEDGGPDDTPTGHLHSRCSHSPKGTSERCDQLVCNDAAGEGWHHQDDTCPAVNA
jgi:hypothetical protein